MLTQYALQIQHTPDALIRIMDAVRPERHDEEIEPGRFTLREVIAHLADWEQIWLDRITLAVEYPGSTVETHDEGDRAAAHNYSGKDVHHELEVFANRRRDTVTYLLGLAVDDWDKTVKHPENGEMSVMDIVNYVIGHDLYHLHQVSLYLK